jgi:hypothetical protein
LQTEFEEPFEPEALEPTKQKKTKERRNVRYQF